MKITQAAFERAIADALLAFRGAEPAASHNMEENATKKKITGNFEGKIYIDQAVAPYWKYTEFTWAETSPVIVNAPRNPSLLGKSSVLWDNGDKPDGKPKKNPNEGWTEGAMRVAAERIAASLGGKITKWSVK